MKYVPKISLVFLLWAGLLAIEKSVAVEIDQSGQMSWWMNAARSQSVWTGETGLRYIPQVSLRHALEDETFVDGDFSLNTYVNIANQTTASGHDLRFYRAQLRYATAQSETRIGLQKIDFGPARLLRPLRWFDQINPNDPLQLTEGVYALMYKYHTQKNTGVWLWGLYGNDDPKGHEIRATAEEDPEIGGRIQYPFLNGEMAVTVHTRMVDGRPLSGADFSEKRIALDGQWDLGIGLWFESVFQHQNGPLSGLNWIKLISVGGDYTFAIGNGLYVLGEHMLSVLSEDALGWEDETHISAFSANYPVGIADQLSASIYYDWENRDWYNFLTWQRQYDSWGFYWMGFSNPDSDPINQNQNEQNLFAGKGMQLLVVFNH